jgi:isopenicillin-N N-acyltransferase-like protein
MASEQTTEVRSLVLEGDAYDRGVTHGEAFAEEIRSNVEVYFDRFDFHGADEATVRDQAEEFVPFIGDANEEYAEEMAGVADGSGVPIEEVAMLNARWEVMYSALADEAAEVDGCTGFGLQPEVTADGNAYMGQNWDWIPPIETFVMQLSREDAPDMVVMTEAGIVGGKIGVNEHGIGITCNGLISAGDGENPFRTPMHVRFRESMDARRLDTAIKPLIAGDRAVSANVILGHAAGEFIDLELSPTTVNYLYPDDGILTHTNHFEDDRVDSEFELLLPDTLCRAPRMRRLFSERVDEVALEDMKEVLRDHFGRPASICRHTDDDLPERDRLQTDGSYVIDLEGRRLHATRGPPCETDYRAFGLAG